jgi:hypothetical protein
VVTADVLLIALAILIVAAVVVDQIATWRDGIPRRLYLPSPTLGWTLRPGLRRRIELSREGRLVWQNDIAINAQGFNDRDWEDKDAGSTRVLVMGDSIVEARQVARTMNFVARAEARLKARGLRRELLNVGVAGWSVDSVLNYFQQAGRHLEADIVVLGLFVGNDLLEGDYETFRYLFAYAWDCRRYDKPAFGLRGGALVRWNFPAWRNLSARLFSVELYERSRSFRRGYQRFNRVMEKRRNGSNRLRASGVSYNLHMERSKGIDYFYRQTEAQVDALAEECRQAGCRFGIMLEPNFPLFYPLDGDADPSSRSYQEYHRDLTHYGEMRQRLERKYPVLSLLEPMHQAGSGITFRPADPHLDDRGHELVSSLLADFIVSLDV